MHGMIDHVVNWFIGSVNECTNLVCAAGFGISLGFVIWMLILLVLIPIAMWLTGRGSPLLLLSHKKEKEHEWSNGRRRCWRDGTV